MLQFVDAFNGNSAGCSHFVDLNAWMGVIVQYQFGGTFYRLGNHIHGIRWSDSHFDARLHGSLNIFQHVSDTAGGQGGSRFQFVFIAIPISLNRLTISVSNSWPAFREAISVMLCNSLIAVLGTIRNIGISGSTTS